MDYFCFICIPKYKSLFHFADVVEGIMGPMIQLLRTNDKIVSPEIPPCTEKKIKIGMCRKDKLGIQALVLDGTHRELNVLSNNTIFVGQ
jgi:hypothetical protein